MTILFLGDSITEGCCVNDPKNFYPNIVGKILKCNVVNYGVCGTRIAPQKVTDPNFPEAFNESFLERAAKMQKEADFVVVFGGTNDFGHGDAPFGEIREFGTFNYYVDSLITNLIATYGNEKIIVVLPIHRWDEDSTHGDYFEYKKGKWPTLEEYRKVIRQISQNHNVKIIDLIDSLPKPKDNTGDAYYADGLHPNDNGQQVIGKAIAKFIKEN